MPNTREKGLTPPQVHSQERARWACTTCRARKIKCDSNLPSCLQCAKRGLSCMYTHVRARAATSRRSMQDTSRRLDGVEGTISKLLVDSPSRFSTETVQANVYYPSILIDLMRLNLLPISRKWEIHLDNTKSFYSSSCEIFTTQHMRCVDYLVGNHSFSSISHDKSLHDTDPIDFGADVLYPLPTTELMLKCLNVFLSYINKEFNLFQDEEITEIFHTYIKGSESLQSSHYAAVSIVCAASLGIVLGCRNEQSEHYLRTSLKTISNIIREPSDTIGIGVIILAVIYLMTTSRSPAAATILGAASKMILVAGYNDTNTSPAQLNLTEAEVLHQNRIFWRAYVLDQELSLRLNKPPLFSDDLIDHLPEVTPLDMYGVIERPDGSTLNCFRQQVVLAILQRKVYRKLRSPRPSKQSSKDFLADYFNLKEEVSRWKDRLNLSLNASNVQTGYDSTRSEDVALLQLGYHQTLIAIHSAIFLHPSLFYDSAVRNQVPSAVDHCAKSGRDLIMISNNYYQMHPLALYYVHSIPWNIDGLFLYMMQNKYHTQTRHDVQLLKSLLDYAQDCVPQYNQDPDFVSLSITHQVAMEVISV